MVAGTRRRARPFALVAFLVALVAAVLVPTAPARAAAPAPGTGKLPPGSTINTPAAYANPLCDKTSGPYGRLDFVLKGGSPNPSDSAVCVAVWKGKDNGGSTARGVTKESVKVVVLLPNEKQLSNVLSKAQLPTNHATGGTGTVPDALEDGLAGYQHVFETYGRKVDLETVVSSGDDETSQRADAVTVVGMKPFAAFDGTYTAHPVFETAVAAAKIVVWGDGATVEATQKQAPYRWGQSDANSAAVNVAEFVGKQLSGKKAQYAGDESLHDKTRKFGVIYSDTVIDKDSFNTTLTKYGAKIEPGAVITYPASSSPFGDPTVAQEMAPTAITKFKDAGATSLLLLADSSMIGALTKQATAQDYHPEWIISAYQYSDLTFFTLNYDQDQWSHAFGIANVGPPVANASTTGLPDPVQWYWGQNKGTFSIFHEIKLFWLMSGIMYAGPKLTPQTFQQGQFAAPALGGSAENNARSVRQGYGRTSGLPYDEYLHGNKDFTVEWYDPDTTGPGIFGFPPTKGTPWYVDGGKRYDAGHWPTKQITFFDKSNSIYQFDSLQKAPEVVPCHGCPSETGQGEPSSS